MNISDEDNTVSHQSIIYDIIFYTLFYFNNLINMNLNNNYLHHILTIIYIFNIVIILYNSFNINIIVPVILYYLKSHNIFNHSQIIRKIHHR